MIRRILKILAIWLLFVAFHFGYRFFPGSVFMLLGCPVETVFQHMKMVFFAYILISLAEYMLRRGSIGNMAGFIYARMLMSTLLAYLVYLIWFSVPILFGLFETLAGEIIYSNIVLGLCITIAVILEGYLEDLSFKPVIKGIILFLFAISLSHYTLLAFKEPPVGNFEVPEEHSDH
jgi:hypothetical protein